MDYSLLVGLHSIRKGNTGHLAFAIMEPTSRRQFKKSMVINESGTELFKEYLLVLVMSCTDVSGNGSVSFMPTRVASDPRTATTRLEMSFTSWGSLTS